MNIRYLGGDQYHLRFKKVTVFLGKPEKKTQADVVVSDGPVDANNVTSKNRQTPFIVSRPGEYEVSGVEVWGNKDLIWYFQIAGWRMTYFAKGWSKPSEKKLDMIVNSDVIFLSPSIEDKYLERALEVFKKISPPIVFLGHDRKTGDKFWSKFLDAIDREDLKPEDNISIKRKDLPEETKIVLLQDKD